MLFLISPAKKLDYKREIPDFSLSTPAFADQIQHLAEHMKGYAPHDLAKLMKLSDALAELNSTRFANFQWPMPESETRSALFAFMGDVYTGIDADTLKADQVLWLNQHLRILSGLYGLLRPLDNMMPYRLEMGTRLAIDEHKDLYGFWGTHITDALNALLGSANEPVINLASQEYFKSVKPALLNAPVITPVFKDLKNGQYKIISFYAKKARGLMVRFAADLQVSNAEQLKAFDYEGYQFAENMSSENEWVFTRDG